MLTEAMSFTIVPTLMFALFSRRCLRVEVLPEPRKPARRMVGIGFFWEDVGVAPSTGDDFSRVDDDDDDSVRDDKGEFE